MNLGGFLILLERPETLGKKDKTVKYLTPSYSSPSSSGIPEGYMLLVPKGV